MDHTELEALASESVSKGKFKFIQAVTDRDYPEIDVPIYLNDHKALQLIESTREMVALDNTVSNLGDKAPESMLDKLAKASETHDALVDELRAEAYIVKIKGVSPETLVEIEDRVFAEFPQEFEEIASPIPNAPAIKREVENPKRDELHATLIRQAHLVSVTAPDGAVDDDFEGPENEEMVRATWLRIPPVARIKIDQAINDSKVAVDYYRELADEVF